MITQRAQRQGSPRLVKPAQLSPPCSEGAFSELGRQATAIRLRRRQLLSFANADVDSTFIIRSGLLALQTTLPGKPRQLLALHYPGDVIGSSSRPSLPGAAACAIVPSELWRLPTATFETLLAEDTSLARKVTQRIAKQEARALLHAAMIGGLSGEERAASFLIELGLHSGPPGAQSMAFDMHMSRNDVADYLALNADTLSRIMSRLKARGLISQMGRSRVIVPNWKALCAESPIASTLSSLYGNDRD